MRSQQIILDRLREARTAVGLHGFNATIHRDFANVLFPYRLHSQRLSRTLFYLSATSLMCKTQLARDVPSSKPTWSSFEHDALVLSRRLSNLPRGEEELKRPGFLRYWCVSRIRQQLDVLETHFLPTLDRFYLVSLGSVSNELEEMEKYLGDVRMTCRFPARLSSAAPDLRPSSHSSSETPTNPTHTSRDPMPHGALQDARSMVRHISFSRFTPRFLPCFGRVSLLDVVFHT